MLCVFRKEEWFSWSYMFVNMYDHDVKCIVFKVYLPDLEMVMGANHGQGQGTGSK